VPPKTNPAPMGGYLSVPLIARKFHLSRSATSSPTQGTPTARLKRKLETPIFYERTKRPASENASPSRSPLLTPASEESLPSTHSPAPTTPRKRPGATVAEKKWREKHWQESAEPSSPIAEPAPKSSPVPIERFLAFADEVDAAEEHIPSQGKDSAHRLPARYKPKVPARRKDRVPAPQADSMEIVVPDDSDLVTDMYIRVPLPGDHDVDMNSKNIGLLVIEAPEQDFWDSWIEDGRQAESDKEFDTDDEDENGE